MDISRREFLSNTAARAAALVSMTALTTGCERRRDSRTQPDSEPELSSLTMQAAWVNDAEFMGYFVALQHGWYEDEGLDLTYLPGGPDVIPESSLLSGRADLALTTPDTTINLILREKAPLKIIGTQYQKSPLGVVSLKKNSIGSPKDLVGKTLAVPPVNILSVKAMLNIAGVSEGDVKIVPYAYDPTPLITEQVDATIDFVTNVPYTIQQAGSEAEHFLMYDEGFTIYNDTVVVREETLREKRKELVAWLRASRRGWDENFIDPTIYPPQFAGTWFKGNGRDIENEVFFNRAQKPLIEHPKGVFTMTLDGIEKNIEALAAIGLDTPRNVFVTDLLDEV